MKGMEKRRDMGMARLLENEASKFILKNLKTIKMFLVNTIQKGVAVIQPR